MRASERAYATLRDEILDGVLEPGTQLAEVEQSTRLGVSRTPVRAAFTRLTADGLVRAQSPRVLVVTDLSAERIREVYELRQALEATAASLAARRRDEAPFAELRERLAAAPQQLEAGESGVARYFEVVDDLDAAISAAVANPYLEAALSSARLHSARVRRIARHDPDRLREAAAEHLLVVDAILAGDAELATHATHVHLSRSLRNALARIDT
ncbi:GntR family transcriptional regulator [Gulosibacter faecalis]|jgi:DNA-binding GntR family transcriptional regulator|uniref:GntR family transcriptional regulator n=1 Tax=Gulosibacter faecalis TaxID=272240 RepID=A0ABW5UUQ9_9MICO|nr:GntR family transcriptional regulator [Gulosibacter faecalis]